MSLFGTVILTLLLLDLAASQDYLFLKGQVVVKTNDGRPKRTFTLTSVNHLDSHLLPKATFVKVIARKIINLHKGAVKNMAELKRLSLPSCNIEQIQPEAFLNLPKIKVIHLQDNLVETIEDGVFNFLPIEELYLQRNKIQTIRSQAFDNMPNLVKIQLNSNKLSQWDSSWFKNTPQLASLFFKRNKITSLPRGAFANLKSSHVVNGTELVDLRIFLSKNEIEQVDGGIFEGLDAIDELSLSRNQLEEIPVNLFEHVHELNKLFLQKNRIKELEAGVFKGLEEMEVLQLSCNLLRCFSLEVATAARVVYVGKNLLDQNCLWHLRNSLREERKTNQLKEGYSCKGPFDPYFRHHHYE